MEHRLQHILNKAVDNKKVFGTSFCISYRNEQWCGASGNLETGSQYFIASTTKLFITALTLVSVSEGSLSLDDRLDEFVDDSILNGLHDLGGQDYSKKITVRNLLAHTSGLPDYFQGKGRNGVSLEHEITHGKDQAWTFEDLIESTKSMRAHFAPGSSGKAHYSDTNFQLLAKVIESRTGMSLADNLNESIIQPLGMKNTFLYADKDDHRPATLFFKNKELHIPKAMSSVKADGGIVSTSADMMTFLQAFFKGRLFPESLLDELRIWNKIFYPLQAGLGIQRFKLPWIMDPFQTIPELIGHSGLSSALAFCNPEKDIFITGTVNQVAYPGTSFRLALKLIRAASSTNSVSMY